MSDNQRSQYLTRWTALKTERASWDYHYRDLAQFILPRSSRFVSTDRNRGVEKNNRIYDNTGTRALRTLAAGMMSGMTSPARPWFRLATTDPALMQSQAVKQWLYDVAVLMRRVFAQSNTYRALHTSYEELGVFGTAASIIVPNHENIIHHHTMTAGEYAISTSNLGEVDTIFREFDMTVGQLVKEFGLENCSNTVKNLYSRGGKGIDAWIPVIHVIEPRTDREYENPTAKNMAWASCYFEKGSDTGKNLRESGSKYFNVLAPRWAVTSADIYGYSPAMDALGDIRQLQQQQLRKAEAIDYQTKPPLQAPTAMKEMAHQLFPGGISFVDSTQGSAGIRTAFETRLDLGALLNDIQDVRSRINGAFYADLFLMLANDTRSGTTATEIAERHEEKMLMLGPVIERLGNEQLDPLIDIAFFQLIEAGALPPAPSEMHGQQIKVEYVSVLAQAQRAVGLQSIDRILGTVGSLMQLNPQAAQKVDVDAAIDEYADILGVNPSLLVSSEKLVVIREQAAAAQRRQQLMEAAPGLAAAAKDVSSIPPNPALAQAIQGGQGMQSVLAGTQGYGP